MKLSENWLTIVSVSFSAIFFAANPVLGQSSCVNNSVLLDLPATACSPNYSRCDDGEWRRAMCVGGVINPSTGECVPYTSQCPDPGVKDRLFSSSRRKRQATTTSTTDCSRAYACPSDLTSIIVYPDWANKQCDSYIVCFDGKLLLTSCLADGFNYYNPRRLSCEEFPSRTNTCVYRLATDLSPMF